MRRLVYRGSFNTMSCRLLVLLALFSASSLIFASAMKASWPHSHHCIATSSRFLHPAINKYCVGKTRSRRSASNSIRYRPIIFASASIAENGNGGNNLSIPLISPTRCSSREAASIIKNSTSHDGLLIVTCDASGRGGGSKHDGIAAILRIRHGASFPSTSLTSQHTKGKGEDLIDVTGRRTVPSRKSSEVAAIALGIKRALRTIPPSCRKRVLILSDSEYALDFFCGSDNNAFNNDSITTSPIRRAVGNSNKRKTRGKSQITQSMELREEAHRRSLVSLIEETPNGILFTKVRSSSRGVGISTNNGTAAANDEVWDGIGFIDHDAADYLSSITRSFVNSHDDEKKIDDLKDMEELPFYAVKSLGQEDLAWLENSDSDQTIVTANNEYEGKGSSKSRSSNNFFQTIEVVGSEARDDRQKRNQRRTKIIQEMLGPSLPTL
mmetsp:Transcript_23062/g.42344  ORF Transcript_23062/g.42344 Transcript_23062/m.42344 type:complete len:439 (+) Transcript_23062:90-1406(+)